MQKLSDGFIALFLFLGVYILHASSFVIQSTDSMWTLPTAVSIVQEGNLDLNEYKKLIKAKKKYGVRIRPKRKIYYNFFPYGTSLLITPLVALYESCPYCYISVVPGAKRRLLENDVSIYDHSAMDVRLELERAIASFLVALCAALWYVIARMYLGSALSVTLVLAFSFGTPAWSTASRGLWQHGPVMLLYTVALWLLLLTKDRSGFTGLPLAFGYLVRPTTSVVWFFTLVYAAFRKKSSALLYLFLSLFPFGLFFYLNRIISGRYLPPYYQPGRLGYHEDFFQALFANLLSPSRGILFQSPFLILALFSLGVFSQKQIQQKQFFKDREIVVYSFICIGAHVLLTSLFPNWWHGHSFGSRYMTDILPFFFILLVLTFSQTKSTTLLILFLFLCTLAIPVHYKGVQSYRPYLWNKHPVNIDYDPSRVWSLSDPQFLR